MTPIARILLDVDGTLIDSNEAHAHAWQDAFAEAGYEVEFEKILRKIGMGGDHVIPSLVHLDPEGSEAKAIEKKRGEIFKANYLPTLKAFDGAADLLKTLKAKGFRLVIATSASSSDLKAILKQGKLDGIVEEVTTSSDADRSKPDPDIIHAALEHGHQHPDGAVMIGDTPYDIEAAKRAHVRTIGFCSGGWSREELLLAGAWHVYADAAALLSDLKSGRSPL